MVDVVTGLRLRVVVDGVSPLIVRTLVVPSGLSLSGLNRVLLACRGWSGKCLHVTEGLITSHHWQAIRHIDPLATGTQSSNVARRIERIAFNTTRRK